jgi:hypothetical protein
MDINGIHIEIMKYSNKGVIILVSSGKNTFRITIRLSYEQKLTVTIEEESVL